MSNIDVKFKAVSPVDGASLPDSLNVSLTITIKELKDMIHAVNGVEAPEQKLIYKGKVLVDSKTLESYNVVNGDVFVYLKSKKKKKAKNTAETVDSSNTTNDSNSASAPNPPISQVPQTRLPSNARIPQTNFMSNSGNLPDVQAMMRDNPEMLSNMMNNPLMDGLFNNPDLLRNMMENNPQMQSLLDQNPQLRHVLRNPELMRRQMELMRNPEMMQEMMRQQDLQLSHLENLPGGYQALRQHFEQVEEPMMEALNGRNQSSSETQDADETPGEENNPWGESTGQSQSGQSINRTGQQVNPLASMLSGINLSQNTPNAADQPPLDAGQLGQMMSNMGALLQGLGGPGTQQQSSSGATQPPNMQDLLQGLRAVNQFVPMQGAGAQVNNDPSLPPEQRYATQLVQLEQMGFTNKRNNLAALNAASGNVDRAIDLLLGMGM